MKKLFLCGVLASAIALSTTTIFAQDNVVAPFRLQQDVQSGQEPLAGLIRARTAGGAYITGSNVAFRSSPGLSSTVLYRLQKGTYVSVSDSGTVNKDGYTWYCVEYNGIWGYVANDYLDHTQ